MPLLDWQHAVAATATERDPSSGRHVYPRVVLLVPRRAGKSLLMLAVALAVASQGGRVFYCSAHRENAARMWRDDWFGLLAGLVKAGYVTITRGNGQESITIPGAGTIRLVATTSDAIRGAATNLIIVDEARELSPDQGQALEAAAFPTQATGRGGQTWIVSNAGNGESVWLAGWRDRGRAAVDAGRRDGLALVEYAAPDGADPADEATWFAAHPGLAAGHVHVEHVRADFDVLAPDVFAAEYLGWWPETQIDTELVDAWLACELAAAAPADPVVFALELDVERTRVHIVAAGRDRATGRPAVELLVDREHGTWLAAEVARLVAVHRPLAVVWDAAGPVAALAHDLADVPANLLPLGTRDVTAAAGAFHDLCLAGVIAHRPDDVLTEAVTAARRRRAGGSWLYERRQPGSGPLIAATMALWVHRDRSRSAPTVA